MAPFLRHFNKVIQGSLEVIEIGNGFALYGRDLYTGHKIHLAHLGDGVDSHVSDPSYDPNLDHDLPEAYRFEIVS